MKNSIMMQSPILSKGKKIKKIVMLPEQNFFEMPPSLQKKEHKKETKPRGYTSLHSSEYIELTQSNPS